MICVVNLTGSRIIYEIAFRHTCKGLSRLVKPLGILGDGGILIRLIKAGRLTHYGWHHSWDWVLA